MISTLLIYLLITLSAILTKSEKPSGVLSDSLLAIDEQKSLALVEESTSNASSVSSGKYTCGRENNLISIYFSKLNNLVNDKYIIVIRKNIQQQSIQKIDNLITMHNRYFFTVT